MNKDFLYTVITILTVGILAAGWWIKESDGKLSVANATTGLLLNECLRSMR